MTAAKLRNIEPGTRLLAADAFVSGEDYELTHLLGKVVTLRNFDGSRWVYCEEAPENPFEIREIVGLAEVPCIDEDVEYQHGDIELIFGR